MRKGWQEFQTMKQFLDAVRAGAIPETVVSPGAAAVHFGVTRQAVEDRVRRGTLRGIRVVETSTRLVDLANCKEPA